MKALVAGSAHLDIIAHPSTKSEHRDRRGQNTISVGGTACNIALGLAKAGREVRLLTAWSNDPLTSLIESHITAAGIEVMADVDPDMHMAAFVALLTIDGDLDAAVSDTPVETHKFTEDRLEEALAGVDYLVMDSNLELSSLATLARLAHGKGMQVFVLGVSEDKVDAILQAAGYLTAAFVNHAECEKLMRTLESSDHSDVAAHLGAPLFVTRGDRGAVVYLPDGQKVKLPPLKLSKITNLLGVGDAFSTGIIDAMTSLQFGYEEAAEWAGKFVAETAKNIACNGNSRNALNILVGDLYQDKLTGLQSRRYFEANYLRHAAGCNAILMVDCDHFKSVNDTFGHQEGDKVLGIVSSLILDTLRSTDIGCRWGGDEFIILLPRTQSDKAMLAAERLRTSVEAMSEILHGVTLSIGVAISVSHEPLADILQHADAALYEVKRNGRNGSLVVERATNTRAVDNVDVGTFAPYDAVAA